MEINNYFLLPLILSCYATGYIRIGSTKHNDTTQHIFSDDTILKELILEIGTDKAVKAPQQQAVDCE